MRAFIFSSVSISPHQVLRIKTAWLPHLHRIRGSLEPLGFASEYVGRGYYS